MPKNKNKNPPYYIYLDNDERKRFAQVGHEYLVDMLIDKTHDEIIYPFENMLIDKIYDEIIYPFQNILIIDSSMMIML
jgi:hypothetical protein